MWKQRVNSALIRVTGYQLSRPAGHRHWRLPPPTGERLLAAPVFILSAARSGSTLLRSLLGSHSRLYAPPEVHLAHLSARAETSWIRTSMQALHLTQEELDYLLWDSVLAGALRRSGKPTIVVKTPSNALIWDRLAECWPDARFIFLLRHPAAAVSSLHASWRPQWHPGENGTLNEAISKGRKYMAKVEEARGALGGFTVRYEDITTNPETAISRVCEFIGVRFEPAMLEYGQFASNHFKPGLGDASAKIRSGRIQPAVPSPRPADIPAELRDICAAWGYLEPAGSLP